MGLKNTEIVEAREKELRDCLLSPETEHIDSCFDSEDEEDACERAHGGDTWRKRFASATCGITSNRFWKKLRRLRSVPKQVWKERALLMDERRRQNKTPDSRRLTEGSPSNCKGKPGTLRGEGSSRAQCSPQSQPATPKQHLRGRKANFETSADTKKRTCPEPGEFRDLLREMTHPDDSVGASSKPLLSWRPRVAKSRSASLNDIHHQVTVSSSSSMIDATHPQVVRLSSPPRIDVLVGAIVICGLSLVGFSVFLLRRHIHSQLNQAARRVCVRSNTTACTRRSSRLSTGTACPSCAQRAVVVLQAFARGRQARAHACGRAKAAVRLQSKYRCWTLALAYCRLKCAAVVILVVGCVALVRLACRRELAATVLQAHWRGWRKRASYRRRQQAVVLLHAAGRDALTHLSTTGRASAITFLQSHWQGWRQQASYRRRQHAAVWLRAVGRDALFSANTSRCATAVTLLQIRWRGLRQRACLRRRQHAAVWLNAVGRDVLVHADSSRRASAMTLLQAHYRGWRQRESCRRHQHAALWLHTAGRDALMGVSTSRRTTAITLIQARWRGWRSRAGYRRRQYAAVSLYTAVRDALMRLKSRRRAMSTEGAQDHERHVAASAGCPNRGKTHQRDVAASVGCRKHAEIIIRRILERRRGLLTLAIARNHVAIKTREARLDGFAHSCRKGKSRSSSTVVVSSIATASDPPIKKQHNLQAKSSIADPCKKDKHGLAPLIAGPRIVPTSGSANTKQPTQQPAGNRRKRRNRKPRKATPHWAIAKAVISSASEELGPGTAQGRTSDIHECKVPTPPRDCPMCTFANAGGDEGCRMCGSALPRDSTSDDDDTARREDAGAASSQAQQQLPPGDSATTARASLEGTEDSVYLEMLAEAQRESAALARDLEKRDAEWKQQSKKSRYLSKQKTAVYRGRGNTVGETNPVVPAGTGRFAAFEDDDEDDDDDDHGDDDSHDPGVQEEEEGKLSDEDFEEDLRQAMAASLELHTALVAGTNTPALSGESASGRSPTPPARDNVKPARCKDGSARVGASCGKVEATSQGNGISRIAKPRGHIF